MTFGNFQSYFRRLSFLNEGIRFSVSSGNRREKFCASAGIQEMFHNLTCCHQLVHDPIHFRVSEADLDLELIFAFQSVAQDWLTAFVNKGRAVEGGTHEQGLKAGLNAIRKKFRKEGQVKGTENGIIALLSLHSPAVVWEGCTKSKIRNPELRWIVRRLVIQHTLNWLQQRPDVLQDLHNMTVFTFPDSWWDR